LGIHWKENRYYDFRNIFQLFALVYDRNDNFYMGEPSRIEIKLRTTVFDIRRHSGDVNSLSRYFRPGFYH
jgi:hypothetical protein